MIDFHTHIIPNVDDGSKDIESTFELFKEAKNAGFDTIILTPHYIEDYYEANKKINTDWQNALTKGIIAKSININLYLGNESYISSNLIDLIKNDKVSTINGSRYLLMELPLSSVPINLFDVIKELRSNGIIPIIAHPERYSFIQENPNKVCELLECGVLLQCNFCSILGTYGKFAKIVIKNLLENDLVSFLGSDVHTPKTIYPLIPEAKEQIIEIVGEKEFNIITCKNPIRVIKNEIVETKTARKIKLSLKDKIQMKMK